MGSRDDEYDYLFKGLCFIFFASTVNLVKKTDTIKIQILLNRFNVLLRPWPHRIIRFSEYLQRLLHFFWGI